MTTGTDPARSGHSGGAAEAEVTGAVLRAVLAVTERRGYHGTTLARVAEEAGLDPDVVGALFPNRGEMLRAALELAFQRYVRETPTWKDTEPLPDLREELGRRLSRGVATGVSAGDFWRLGMLLNLEPLLADSDCGRLFLEVREITRQALRDYWSRIVPDDIADRATLVELAARAHMALGDGSVLAAQATPDWDVERMMQFVARGVATLLAERTQEQEPS